eukprot:CAMPEP_0170558846 /NCGR_PEP_ID=MMETSP0211-20121228/38259_1 /TAXON_ID=311385 /ORGANISM="Pseudokeronopsis sp., Strain OXSARD2" /LENGTH=53 /DNA_ID=CAMNT_0010871209 /DNA_START=439 /DNA_END=600 /DNA_ORIENTATION=-
MEIDPQNYPEFIKANPKRSHKPKSNNDGKQKNLMLAGMKNAFSMKDLQEEQEA